VAVGAIAAPDYLAARFRDGKFVSAWRGSRGSIDAKNGDEYATHDLGVGPSNPILNVLLKMGLTMDSDTWAQRTGGEASVVQTDGRSDPSVNFHKGGIVSWACPAHTRSPKYIRKIGAGDYDSDLT